MASFILEKLDDFLSQDLATCSDTLTMTIILFRMLESVFLQAMIAAMTRNAAKILSSPKSYCTPVNKLKLFINLHKL